VTRAPSLVGPLLARKRSLLAALAISASLAACTRRLDVDVELAVALSPDPFEGVRTVRLLALEGGRIVVAGEGRWDQGPLALPTLVSPDVERFVVVGLDASGRVVSSGASAPLDLLHTPPSGPIRVPFTRVGVLSIVERGAAVRRGGSALSLHGDRVLFLGGVDAEGCAVESTELYAHATSPPLEGPRLTGGRSDALSFDLGDGGVFVAGGVEHLSCGPGVPSDRIAILDLEDGTSDVAASVFPASRRGAAVLAVSEGLVIAAGGDDETTVSADLFRFDPRTRELSAPGKLDLPRAQSAATLVAGGRVLLAGGRSRLEDASALDDAVVFDPARGAGEALRIRLGAPVIAPAALRTIAGSVILAGGRDRDGAPVSRVSAVVAQPERAVALGDTSTITALPSPSSGGALVDLLDGSVLHVPRAAGAPLARIGAFPRAATSIDVPSGVEGRLFGGRVAEGVVLLAAEDGTRLLYNPGPRAVLGVLGVELWLARAASTDLAELDAELGTSLGAEGIVPLRPVAWSRDGRRLEGRLLPELPPGGLLPGELAVLGASKVGDFDARFELDLAPLSQAAFVFGLDDGELDVVTFLGGLTLVGRSRLRAEASPLDCASAETPALAEPGVHALRVQRRGAEVRVDVGDDGTDELVCHTPDPVVGHLAFGVVTGEAGFQALDLELPPR
jgi:hypothetical protein